MNSTRTRLANVNYSADHFYFIKIEIAPNTTIFDHSSQLLTQSIWFEQVNRYSIIYSHHFFIDANQLQAILEWRSDRVAPYKNPVSLTKFIAQFKSKSTVFLRKNGASDFCWQRGFFERIIRNKAEFDHFKQKLK
ncbi:hypothetical protein A9G09_04490 [Gilliamella sp. wkB292]|uniref:hypothetical protein n=1 Tax=unclassified Gilliamella TaxID=2685620 RepID=UPI00080E171D|nr:hypothetical protein [Gilliamella apicola]OCG15487.1 hypothetical protein A9G09_04490 [Gilliamella apicola]OCL21510.1 hypothetical protein A9G03_05525 [Gilliamella apicola]